MDSIPDEISSSVDCTPHDIFASPVLMTTTTDPHTVCVDYDAHGSTSGLEFGELSARGTSQNLSGSFANENAFVFEHTVGLDFSSLNNCSASVEPVEETSVKTSKNCNRLGQRSADKQSNEYRLRRDRNNKFVRACREKARHRHKEVENRVNELLSENKQLSQRVESLTSELAIYRNLFVSVGASVPPEVERVLARSVKSNADSVTDSSVSK